MLWIAILPVISRQTSHVRVTDAAECRRSFLSGAKLASSSSSCASFFFPPTCKLGAKNADSNRRYWIMGHLSTCHSRQFVPKEMAELFLEHPVSRYGSFSWTWQMGKTPPKSSPKTFVSDTPIGSGRNILSFLFFFKFFWFLLKWSR